MRRLLALHAIMLAFMLAGCGAGGPSGPGVPPPDEPYASDPMIQQLYRARHERQRERDAVASVYGVDNPSVQELEMELAHIEQMIVARRAYLERQARLDRIRRDAYRRLSSAR